MATSIAGAGTPATMPGDVEPIYFGRGGKPLFGCFHAPSEPVAPGIGVVFCSSVAEEYIRCHRPLRILAAAIANDGIPTFRFDYYGSGDSLGACEDGSVSRWLDDLRQAIRYLRGRCRANRITLVGVRFGAALAMLFGAERESVERLVLWDPIVRGRSLTEALRELRQELETGLITRFGPRPDAIPDDGPTDLYGSRFSQALIDEIDAVDLMTVDRRPARRALILNGSRDPASAALVEHLHALGVETQIEISSGPKIWQTEPFQGIVPVESLQLVRSWVGDASR